MSRNFPSTFLFSLVMITAGVPSQATAQDEALREKQVDNSITRALQYLARSQAADGAWQINNQSSTAATSLAVMAFMAGGHLPGEGPYGDQIELGIQWILNHQQPSGLFASVHAHGAMYSHGITTLMLAEVVGMVDRQNAQPVRTALEKAVKVILNAQNLNKPNMHAGGWRYNPDSRDSDLSVTGWQLLALRAAKNVGCDVPADNIDAAIDYVKKCSFRNDRGFGYTPGRDPTPTMTGTGIVALEVCGEHHSDEVIGGARLLLSRPLRTHDTFYYYGAYYNVVGLFKVGGDYWKNSKEHLIFDLLNQQRPDGSWLGRDGEESAGPIYSTSLAVLALAVEYQYLPIYQR